jgi:hypothetical protein
MVIDTIMGRTEGRIIGRIIGMVIGKRNKLTTAMPLVTTACKKPPDTN